MAASVLRWVGAALVLLGSLLPAPVAAAQRDDRPGSRLTADNLLLIVNQNEPAGMRLATFYTEQRHVPAGRILALDLPKTDEVSFDDYNAKVVPAVRAFLNDNKLAEDVSCLVTFFGVPLRVGPRSNSPGESAEYRHVAADYDKTIEKVQQGVAAVEELAKQVRPDFKSSAPPDRLATRAESAIAVVVAGLIADTDEARRHQRFEKLTEAMLTLFGPLELAQRLTMQPYVRLVSKPMPPQEQAQVQQTINRLVQELNALGKKAANDSEARAKLRAAFAENLGALRTLQVVVDHKTRLETRETEAAVDSELACLWWPDSHIRYRWHENPLHYRIRFAAQLQESGATRPSPQTMPTFPRTLMVMRIDAPTEQKAQELIATSIAVEAKGLKGNVAIDARGKPSTDPYGVFDEELRRLAFNLRDHSKVPVTLDNGEPVFPPGSVKDVAAYCGWYSLRHYVPGMTFVPGAVGYHVASSELVTLHNPNEKGWVHGLMNDGVVATLGPVAEPYLHAFPRPDEFFPLLMTGKLTLAEVYWLTNPLVSWMNTCIGDPLYMPYAKEPPLKVEDLSSQLQHIFD
jgi:uncharacterized protein (TIGR03790 family)